ncbi:MAG: glycosyl hydrolase family 39 [Ginsengibacter sp.]
MLRNIKKTGIASHRTTGFSFLVLNSFKMPCFTLAFIFLCCQFSSAQNIVTVNWEKITMVAKTTPTLQVVVNPMLERNSPIHDGSMRALKDLGADYVRFVPWHPYPHMAVAELKPPTKTETFWDFRYADPFVEDFVEATKGHPVILNFSTIPVWMFKTDQSVEVPKDPDQVFWGYNAGTGFRDTTLREVADYYVRLFSWYTKGGFTDEIGKFHKSGHFYNIQYWEVLNEMEHRLSPQLYTRIYDAVVLALKKISPDTKFVGLALGAPNNPDYFEYFLNPANHKPGVTLDGISYHFYASPSDSKPSLSNLQYSYFDKADGFLGVVRYVENIRKRLSPSTFTQVNEIGTFIGGGEKGTIIPGDGYWNLSGAVYAYIYLGLTELGIDVAGESQLVGYPTQFPDVTMIDWKNAKPNARYWVLKLLKDNLGPGDKLAESNINSGDISVAAFVTGNGRKMLLINKRNREVQLQIPKYAKGASMTYVDLSTGENPPKEIQLSGNTINLNAFSVAIIDFGK